MEKLTRSEKKYYKEKWKESVRLWELTGDAAHLHYAYELYCLVRGIKR